MKNFSDTAGKRTGDLPTCSVVPQPTAPFKRCMFRNLVGRPIILEGFSWFRFISPERFLNCTINGTTPASFHMISNTLFISHPTRHYSPELSTPLLQNL